jgi:predicted phage-related endonuclease
MTTQMALTAAQQAMRRTGITATDAVVLASGSDHYGRTAHDVWTSKVLGIDDFEPTEATEIGTELEAFVVERAARKLSLEVALRPGVTIAHPEHSRCIATPDGWVVPWADRASGFLQTKVVGFHMSRAWGDSGIGAEGIPETVLIQCAWEMFVGEKDVAYVGALLGTEVRVYQIHRKRDGIDDLVGGLRILADRFLTDYVDTAIPPPVDGSEGAKRMLAAVWPNVRQPVALAPPEAEEAARAYFDAGRAEKKAKEQKELASQRLKEIIADRSGLRGDGWRATLAWRDPTVVKGFERSGYRHLDCRPSKG